MTIFIKQLNFVVKEESNFIAINVVVFYAAQNGSKAILIGFWWFELSENVALKKEKDFS